MHRLTIFKHDIVCYIYNIIDRPKTTSSQSALNPLRRRADFYILNSSCRIARTDGGVGNFNLCIIINVFIVSRWFYFRYFKLSVKGCGAFAGKTDDAHTVRSVGGNLKFSNAFVKTQSFGYVLAYRCIIR